MTSILDEIAAHASLVYEAEDEWRDYLADEGLDPFITITAARELSDRLAVRFDVDPILILPFESDEYGGSYNRSNIELGEGATRSTFTHEFAHHLSYWRNVGFDDGRGHGTQFKAAHVEVAAEVFGPDAARELEAIYQEVLA